MTIVWTCAKLFFSFVKIGFVGFGGGYAMLSMIFTESQLYGVTPEQFADMNALDLIVPGPIAINAATYVGYLASGFWGALAATLGVMLPSFVIVIIAMIFLKKFSENRILNGILAGVKPAAVGLVAAAAMSIAAEVLLSEGYAAADLLSQPFRALSWLLVGVFAAVAVANIRFRVNPILLTVLAGVAGAVFLR